jgi:hypothetical protein
MRRPTKTCIFLPRIDPYPELFSKRRNGSGWECVFVGRLCVTGDIIPLLREKMRTLLVHWCVQPCLSQWFEALDALYRGRHCAVLAYLGLHFRKQQTWGQIYWAWSLMQVPEFW